MAAGDAGGTIIGAMERIAESQSGVIVLLGLLAFRLARSSQGLERTLGVRLRGGRCPPPATP